MQRLEAVERFFQLSLLGLVAAGYLAVAGSGFLDTYTTVLVAAGLLLRALLVAGILRFDLSERLVNILTLSYIVFFALDYFLLSRGLLAATVHLVCFLAVMKILTARHNRDYLYTAVIALMELLSAAILSTNLNFFAFLAVFLLCAIAAFTSAEIRRALQKPSQIVRVNRVKFAPRLATLTAFVTIGILILTAGLFILLPRTANVALRHLISQRYHLTGFSSEVMLGQVGEIQKDSRPVMHVKPSPGPDRMPSNLKWRGAALSNFDGKRWTDLSTDGRELLDRKVLLTLAGDLQRRRRDGTRFSYRVYLNTSDSDALFIAGTPEFLNIEHARVIHTATDSYRLAMSPGENVQYEVWSFLSPGGPIFNANLSTAQLNRYLQIPRDLDPRISALARELAGDATGFDRATRLQQRLRKDYSYTLDLPSSEPADPLANFLFERKKGHCEYFASAMTVMLRTLGIPARLVNGFQSGTLNSISGMYIIRASDAHSWVEAFAPGTGWVTFDPTPSAPRSATNALFTRIAFFFDAADTFWQDWVVNYDVGSQVTLAQRLAERTRRMQWEWPAGVRSWKTQAQGWLRRFGVGALAALALLAAAAIFAPALRGLIAGLRHARKIRKGDVSPADATILYRRMLRLMKRRGYQKPPWFTPSEFAATLPPSQLATVIDKFTSNYQALRFGGNSASVTDLTALLISIEKLRD